MFARLKPVNTPSHTRIIRVIIRNLSIEHVEPQNSKYKTRQTLKRFKELTGSLECRLIPEGKPNVTKDWLRYLMQWSKLWISAKVSSLQIGDNTRSAQSAESNQTNLTRIMTISQTKRSKSCRGPMSDWTRKWYLKITTSVWQKWLCSCL